MYVLTTVLALHARLEIAYLPITIAICAQGCKETKKDKICRENFVPHEYPLGLQRFLE
jgi:hypothetical protein